MFKWYFEKNCFRNITEKCFVQHVQYSVQENISPLGLCKLNQIHKSKLNFHQVLDFFKRKIHFWFQIREVISRLSAERLTVVSERR